MGRAVGRLLLGLALVCAACETGPGSSRQPAPVAVAVRGTAFRSATGTLASWDAASRVIVLRAAGADARYRVAEDARIWVGRERVPLSQLAAHLGGEATLSYAEAEGGERTTHTIRVREGAKR